MLLVWQTIGTIVLTTEWQFTDLSAGSLYRITHAVSGNSSGTLRAVIGQEVESVVFDRRLIGYKPGVLEGQYFIKPTEVESRRLAVQRLDILSPVWTIKIEELIDMAVTFPLPISDVDGLQTALDAKAIASEVQSALEQKAPTVHNHDISSIDGLQSALEQKAIASDVQTALAGLQTALDGKAIASEVQTSLAGLQTALDGKAIASEVETSLAGLQTALEGKAIASEVNTALSGKSNVGHGHQIADIDGLAALIQSIQPSSNIIDSATAPSNPFNGLIWNELTSGGELIETWRWQTSQWRSLTIYKIDYFGPSSGIAGTASYHLPLDDRYNYFFKDYLVNCLYTTGTVDSTTNYYRALITTQPTGATFANSGPIPNDSLTKRFAINQLFTPAIGERLIYNPQKFGTAPNAKIAITLTYQLVRK